MLETFVSTPPTVPDSFLVFAGKCSRTTCGAREISSISLASPSTTGAATARGAICLLLIVCAGCLCRRLNARSSVCAVFRV